MYDSLNFPSAMKQFVFTDYSILLRRHHYWLKAMLYISSISLLRFHKEVYKFPWKFGLLTAEVTPNLECL